MKYLLLLVLAVPSFGQSAKVIPLTQEESQLALRIKNAKEEILKDEETLKEAIVKRHGLNNAEGWYGKFEYSDDYKYIVPAPYTPPYTINGYCNNWINPVYGTTTLTTPLNANTR